MRFCSYVLCLFLCITAFHSARSQTANLQTPSLFQQQAQMAVSGGKAFSTVNLTATAEWIAGSDRESGTAQLQASADGSTNVQLNLGKASRTEVQTKIDSSRTCTWTDSAAKSHDILGANCFVALPWFAPTLYTQSSPSLSAMVRTADGGEVSRESSTLHQINYSLNRQGRNADATKLRTDQSTVKVFYDPKTFLPASLEYSIHPDTNDLQNLNVKIVFSGYQSVSGLMLPYHIEKYVNNSLQLKLDVSNATVE